MSPPVDIYVRVSRVGGREHLISPDEQERDARRFAASRDLAVGEVLTDIDRSGGTLDRPKLREALERIRSGESSGIVVAYLSRLSRETSQGLALLEEVREGGGDVYAPNLSDHTTADGRMLNTIQLAIDAGMRERAKEGLESAKRGAIERGIPINSRAPVGYRKRDDRRLEPDPKTAPHVLAAFEMRAAGAGPAAIAEHLQARGVRTSLGSPAWSKQAVYGMLGSRVYLGEVAYGHDRRYVNTEAHQPLVDLATWTAAQHPNGRPLAPRRNAASPGSLVGLLRCRACGYSMQHTKTSRGKSIYRCTVRHAAGRCPAPARVDADAAEACAEKALWGIYDDIEAIHRPEGVDLAPLREAFARSEARLRQVETEEAQDAYGDRYLAVVKERRQARDEAARALGAAEAEAKATTALPERRTLRQVWETGKGIGWAKPVALARRDLLSIGFDCFAVDREGTFLVYPAGTGPKDLPTRGYSKSPTLHPIAEGGDVPFETLLQRVGDSERATG